MKNIRALIAFCLLVSASVSITNCAVNDGKVYEKDGIQYGVSDGLFKEKWNDFYLRGYSYSQGGYWAEAAADFEQALKQRNHDKRRARSYGMHFIDYFPSRELGIACYNMGDIPRAVKLLEASLADIETARTKYYLNKARKRLIEQSGLDNLPPAISVDFPKPGFVTNKESIVVRCSATDDSYVSFIELNGQRYPFELAQKQALFTHEVLLHHGENSIRVRAEDILGASSPEVVLRVRLDREGPLVFLEAVRNADGSITIAGAAYDASSVAKLTIHTQSIAPERGMLVRINERLRGDEGAGLLRIPFSAQDTVGNITSGFLQIQPVSRAELWPYAVRIASAQPDAIAPALPRSGTTRSLMPQLYAALEQYDGRGSEGAIDLKGLNDGQTLFVESLFVEGKAFLPEGIKDIAVNGRSILAAEENPSLTAMLQEMAKDKKNSLAFSSLVSLNEGANSIVVTLTGHNGSVLRKSVTVYRKIPAARQIGSRLAVSIYPFKESAKSAEPVADYIQTHLSGAFVNQRRFNVLERQELERLFEEQRISQEKVFDQETAVRLGRMMAAEAIVMGDIFSTETSVEVVARLVDTESSLILAEKDIYWEGANRSGLRESLEGLGLKFKQHFPLCEGRILRRQSDQVIINLGADQAIFQGMRFVVFNEAEPIIDPDTHEALGADTELAGLVSTREVREKFSKGDIIKLFSGKDIHENTRVITK